MRDFDYGSLAEIKWENSILNLVAKIHERKGRQDLFVRQKPIEIKRLAEIARIQSTASSNKIEGIITTDTRIKQLVEEKVAPKNRDEREIMGYKDVLNTIHESHDYIPLRPSYILQLHRDLFKRAGMSFGGHFKNTQNYISETTPDGNSRVRFTPVAPYETEPAIQAICDSYATAINTEKVDSLLVIFTFIVDFLCIHPFNDGNGRMSRLLTMLLLYQNGYEVGKYISIEKQIEETKDAYYDALQSADYLWHEGKNDPTPFVKYMLEVVLACYTQFEERIGILEHSGSKSTAYDIVKAFAENKVGKFTGSEAVAFCPSVSRSSVLSALRRLVAEGFLIKIGAARSTSYVRAEGKESSNF